MKRKKKKFNSLSSVLSARREQELRDNNKLVSLRPSIIMKSKRDYKRKWNLKDYIDNE